MYLSNIMVQYEYCYSTSSSEGYHLWINRISGHYVLYILRINLIDFAKKKSEKNCKICEKQQQNFTKINF